MRRRLIKIVVDPARPRTGWSSERGFTLVELIWTMGLLAVVFSLAVFALRQYWFQRSLVGGRDQVVTQLRQLQQRTVGEGVTTRYYGAWFDVGTDDWGVVVYNSTGCTRLQRFEFDAGVESNVVDTTAGTEAATQVAACRTTLAATNASWGDAEFVFFLPRGAATETESPDHIELIQPRLDGRTRSLSVLGLTGRVDPI